jgi:hypothetical protein
MGSSVVLVRAPSVLFYTERLSRTFERSSTACTLVRVSAASRKKGKIGHADREVFKEQTA